MGVLRGEIAPENAPAHLQDQIAAGDHGCEKRLFGAVFIYKQ